jgi:hypothetical protein
LVSSVFARAIQPLATAQSPDVVPCMPPSIRATRAASAPSPAAWYAAYACSISRGYSTSTNDTEAHASSASPVGEAPDAWSSDSA